jgi:hypothetical protein
LPVAAAMIVTAHASDAMVAIPFWLEMFAVVAASISGVLVAREHKLDLVGAVALAVVCGLGGGLLRDMTLQVGNVYILNQPMALPLSIATAAIIYIFPAIVDKPEKLIPLLDIISVGIYAATGADKAGLRLCAGGVHHDGLFYRGGRRHAARWFYGCGAGYLPAHQLLCHRGHRRIGKLCLPCHERLGQQCRRTGRLRRGDHGTTLAVAAL